ncbi:MAG: hypothetical protein KF908_05200 [Nitrosomonas sp.]|nr:hypothetical protein [Nitrosomonas sp.]
MYEKLLEKIAADHAGQNAIEIAEALNAKSIAIAVPAKVSDIKKYLVLAGKYLQLGSSDNVSARVAVEVLNTFQVLNVQEIPVLNKLTEILDALVSADLLSDADKSAIIGIGQEMRSWSQINLGLDVQEWQIQEALNVN